MPVNKKQLEKKVQKKIKKDDKIVINKTEEVKKKKKRLSMIQIFFIIIGVIVLYNSFSDFFAEEEEPSYGGLPGGIMIAHKPVIYLYPQEITDVSVVLDYDGEIFADYPDYDEEKKGWDVTAYPDSTIINKADNKEYSYLFWEGEPSEEIEWDLDPGFVVKGSESREFLQDVLPKTGMTPKEYNEFIVYWYPLMQDNQYNLIHFSGEQYTERARLETFPKYDSLLRVFMVVKPLEKPIDIEEQTFEEFERKGFTVVEWGGSILK